MIPFNHTKLKYGEYKTVSKDIDFMVYFDDIAFPFNNMYPETIVNKVVSPVINKFNKIGFRVHFNILGWDIIKSDGSKFNSDSYIYYKHHGHSMCPESIANIKVIMGLWEGADIDGMQDTLKHEIIHGLGFGHKKQIVDINMPYDNGELNNDDIHGIYTIYDTDTKYKKTGNVSFDMSAYNDCQIFLVDKAGRLKYQSPVDFTGYYEFRSNVSLATKRLLVIAKDKKGKLYYSFDLKNLHYVDSYNDIPGIRFGG